MNAARIEEIANAVLYEGYILYPYRPSSLKNRQRFNFGVIAPLEDGAARASGEQSFLQTECLVRADPESALTVRIRFLQIVERAVCRSVVASDGSGNAHSVYAEVETLEVGGRVVRGWQEAIEREVTATVRLHELLAAGVRREREWPGEDRTEPLRADDGRMAGAVVRRTETVRAEVTVSARRIEGRLFAVAVRIANTTQASGSGRAGRDAWLMRSLVSTHAIVSIAGGECLSLVDPPEDAREHARACRQAGLWPVLVGDAADRDAILASPIILYDYPQIAPESAGDFCDGTEIDEMLALRILTMTDAEKREMREGDERGRRMLERTESLSDEHMMKLHGVLRGLHALDDEGVR